MGISTEQEEDEEIVQRLPIARRLAYGVGHVLNDLCASMWFSYLLVYYHFVISLPNSTAGLLLLIGQVVDALCTPVIGYFCDKTRCFYGRRKIWHLIGTICVASSFTFIYHICFNCENVDLPYLVLYYACFIAVFQFGWAATQISHLALIPDLTRDKNMQVSLNSIRYGFTVLSNLAVSMSMWQLLQQIHPDKHHSGSSGIVQSRNVSATGSTPGKINYSDRKLFWLNTVGIVCVGLVFSVIFHLGTKEPKNQVNPHKSVDTDHKKDKKVIYWYMWFSNPHFYLVAVIYMCTRLMVNVSQVYTPLYVLEVIDLDRPSVAKATLVIYISSFVFSFVVKYLNKYLGRYITYVLGLVLLWGAIIWFQLQPKAEHPLHRHVFHNLMPYGADLLLGASGSILLVTSLSMTADLIGPHVSSGAFVYGAMSFTDKLANGIAIQIIQLCHPCNKKGETCCSLCHIYYRQVMVYGPGGPSLIAFAGLIALFIYLRWKQKQPNFSLTSPMTASSEQLENKPLLTGHQTCKSCKGINRCMCNFSESSNKCN